MNGEETKKVNEVAMIIGTLIAIPLGLVCFVFDFFAPYVSVTLQTAFYFGLLGWEMMSGATPGSAQLARQGLKLLIGEIPLFGPLALFWLTVYMRNHPQITQAIGGAVGKVAGGAIGGPVGAKIGGAVAKHITKQ